MRRRIGLGNRARADPQRKRRASPEIFEFLATHHTASSRSAAAGTRGYVWCTGNTVARWGDHRRVLASRSSTSVGPRFGC